MPMSNKSQSEKLPTAIVTPQGRMSFVSVWEPNKMDNGDEKFEVTLLFPPNADLRPLKKVLDNAAVNFFGPPAKWPQNMRKPSEVIKDAGEKSYSGYKDGWFYVKFSSKERPGVVDAARNIVLEKHEVYAGRWARVSANAFAYDNKAKGVAFGLNSIQLLEHAESFTGRGNPQDDFDNTYDDTDVSRRDQEDDDTRTTSVRGGSVRDRVRNRDDDDEDRQVRGRRVEEDRGSVSNRNKPDRDEDRSSEGRGRGHEGKAQSSAIDDDDEPRPRRGSRDDDDGGAAPPRRQGGSRKLDTDNDRWS